MKIAVIGAGSTYTPELVEGIGRRAELLAVDELALHDIDAGRLEVVGGLARRMLDRAGYRGRLRLTQNRPEAVEGAGFVLVQLRVGGLAARLNDETIPPRFGCLGQETTGAGGFAKGLRTVPVVLDIAEDMARLGGDGAWLLDFTNPAGLVTQALSDHGHRAIGLCNIPIGFQREFAKQLGVEAERVQLEHVGLNHLSWERGVLVDGEDRLPGLIETFSDQLGELVDMPGSVVRMLGALPSYYLRYFYFPRETVAKQADETPRAKQVMEIEAQLLEMYTDPGLDTKPKLLEQRGGAFYSEAAAMLVESLQLDRGDVQVVNVRNAGAIPNVDAEAVVEVPCRITASGAEPLPQRPLPPEMLGLVEQVKAYERLTAEAAVSGDRTVALKALMANPLVLGFEVAEPLLDAILEANRELLPRFFAAGRQAAPAS
ncbi:MAG: 6-phospho-beta-glucosidase [Gaiellales bacterium]